MKSLIVGILSAWLLLSSAQAQESGWATYYTKESCQRGGLSGVYTASGEVFDESAPTCARRSHRFGSKYIVTNIETGESVIVRHNDFGPERRLYKKGYIIDLSPAAFKKLAPLKKGRIKVRVSPVANNGRWN